MARRAIVSMLMAACVALVTAAARAGTPDPAALAKALAGPTSSPAVSEALTTAKAALASLPAVDRASAPWLFVEAMVSRVERNWRAMRDAMERVVALEPGKAEYQFWYGNSILNGIADLGELSQLSSARKGRDAYAQAVRLDPSFVEAHVALARFYADAPETAGGSVEKARTETAILLAMPGGRGAFQARMLLARFAANDKDWVEMSRQYEAAETAGGEGSGPAVAFSSHALALIRQKGDPAAALPVLDRYDRIARKDDNAPALLRAEAYRALKRHREAADLYAKVLAANPGAVSPRWAMAECLEAAGDRKGAAAQYEEFAKRFPKDSRAFEASERARKLR